MKFVFIFVLVFTLPVYSWNNHFLGTYLALKENPEIANAKPVKVESFQSFVNKQAPELERLLDSIEKEAQQIVPNYPPRPDSLRFNASDKQNQAVRVLRALRLNPESKLKLFVQEMPGTKRKDKKVGATDVSVYKEDKFLDTLPLFEIKEGSVISPLQVIATAADEPDYGHDINVWEDSDSEFGKEYKFGVLPFGNPKYHFATQAPFHMGFYYEAGIIYTLAPNFKRTYPEIRIHQFTRLAEFAFSKGHDYWGYRFMGWAMHYLEDLTQPYHSKLSPGVSTAGALWVEFKSIIGFKEGKKELLERLSDRHTAIENYQYEFLKELLEKGNLSHPMVKAYQETSLDAKYPSFDFQYPRNVIALEANQRAEELDERIGNSNYVMAFKEPLVDKTTLQEDEGKEKVNEYLNQLMNSFGSHVRNFARYLLSKQSLDKI